MYNRIRIPFLALLIILALLDITGVINVPSFIILAVVLFLFGIILKFVEMQPTIENDNSS